MQKKNQEEYIESRRHLWEIPIEAKWGTDEESNFLVNIKLIKFGFQVKRGALYKKQNFMKLNPTKMLRCLITDDLEKKKRRINYPNFPLWTNSET